MLIPLFTKKSNDKHKYQAQREAIRQTALYRILEYMFIHDIIVDINTGKVQIKTSDTIWMSDNQISENYGILVHTVIGDRGIIKTVEHVREHTDKNLYEKVLTQCQLICRDYQRKQLDHKKHIDPLEEEYE